MSPQWPAIIKAKYVQSWSWLLTLLAYYVRNQARVQSTVKQNPSELTIAFHGHYDHCNNPWRFCCKILSQCSNWWCNPGWPWQHQSLGCAICLSLLAEQPPSEHPTSEKCLTGTSPLKANGGQWGWAGGQIVVGTCTWSWMPIPWEGHAASLMEKTSPNSSLSQESNFLCAERDALPPCAVAGVLQCCAWVTKSKIWGIDICLFWGTFCWLGLLQGFNPSQTPKVATTFWTLFDLGLWWKFNYCPSNYIVVKLPGLGVYN